MTWKIGCFDPWDATVRAAITAEVPPGFTIEFVKHTRPDELARVAADSDFILVGLPHVPAALIKAAPRLRMIHKWGIGFDSIDLDAARRAGVHVAITAGGNSSPVAEHAIMLMLAVYRRLSLVDRALRRGEWLFSEMRSQCLQLRGKTIGIVGFGNIGRALARKIQGFEVDLLYYDPRRAPEALEQELKIRPVALPELLAQSDIVTLHCPGGTENRHFIGAAAFAAMKPGAVLINAARGEIVDDAALVDVLKAGKLSGAGLDVYDVEPLRADHPLLAFDNVVLSPHTAASVFDNVGNTARHAFRNMQRVVAGEPIPPQDAVVIAEKPRVFTASNAPQAS